MIDVLHFIFTDLAHFLGTIVLIYVIGEALAGVVSSFRKAPST